MTTYWLVMRLMDAHEALTLQSDQLPILNGVKLHTLPGDPRWFLPVFDNFTEAEEWSENGRFQVRPMTAAPSIEASV